MPPFDQLTVFDDITPRRGPANMAVDQTLLETASLPLLRAYRWERPQLSIGYFQRFAEIANPSALPVVRRWTGGGTVPHGGDWTFSLIVPKTHPFALLSPQDSYCAIHRAVSDALAACGFPDTTLSGSPIPGQPALSCFTSPVRDDVMRGHQKVAGGAQRRSRHGLLHQGSIQSISPPPHFLAGLASRLSHSQSSKPSLTEPENSLADGLAQSRYASPDWLRRR